MLYFFASCSPFRHRTNVRIHRIMMCGTLCLAVYLIVLSCCILLTGIHSATISQNIYIYEDDGQSQGQQHSNDFPQRKADKRRFLADVGFASNRESLEPKEGSPDPPQWRPYSDNKYDTIFIEGGESHEDSSELWAGDSVIEKIEGVGRRKLPQSLIIGVKKGGTRALLTFLRLHPDIRAPGPEPHFFDKNYDKGIHWYRQQMPSTLDGQITMEKTPSYFITKEAPKRIRNMSKNVKLIIVVRDPVTRAVSDYTQAASKRPGIKKFEQLAFLDNTTWLVDTSWSAIRIGIYAKHIERWLKFFPLEQIHFVNGEKLISDPAGEMAKVQDFLGIKRIVTNKHFYINGTRGFPCLKKPEGSGSPHCLGKTKGRQHPNINEKVLQRLRNFYKPFNAKFYQIVGQDFGWN